MSVILVRRKADREGQVTAERKGAFLELKRRKYKAVFDVRTNDLNDGPHTILIATGIPKIGDPYTTGTNDNDPLATCISVIPKFTENPFAWEVEAEYDTARIVDATIDNPLNAPPEIRWTFTPQDRAFVRDVLGTAVVNTSGDAFDPPLTRPFAIPTVQIVRNEPSFSAAFANLYWDAVNTDTFAGAVAGAAKILNIGADKQIDLGVSYQRVTYEIGFNRYLWYERILDAGFRDALGSLFLDPITAAPSSIPLPMNGRGQKLTIADTDLDVTINSTETVIRVSLNTSHLFPPLTPHPHAGAYEIKIDNEIMQVIGQAGASNQDWNVIRGFAGTVAAPHTAAAAVSLQPYYLRFLGSPQLPLSVLNLPAI